MLDIVNEIMNEIKSNGSDKGNRAMHQALTRKGFAVDQKFCQISYKRVRA